MSVSQWAVPDAKRLAAISADAHTKAGIFRSGLPSGDAAAALGVDRRRTPFSLYQVKTSDAPYHTADDHDRIEVTVAFVPGIVGLFADRQDLTTRRVGILASKARPWQLATIDALTSDGGLLDVTTTTRRHRDDWVNPATGAETIPAHARARALHDLAVTGRSHAWIACVILEDRELLVRRIDRDETAITELIETEAAFWTGYVLARVEPPLTALDTGLVADVHPIVGADSVEDLSITALRERREQLMDELAYIKGQVDEIDAQAKHIAGDARSVTADGETVFSWNYGGSSFDTKAFAAEHPDLLAAFTVPTTRFDWMGLLAEHPEHVAYRTRCVRWTPSVRGRKTDPTRSHRHAWSTAA